MNKQEARDIIQGHINAVIPISRAMALHIYPIAELPIPEQFKLPDLSIKEKMEIALKLHEALFGKEDNHDRRKEAAVQISKADRRTSEHTREP